MATIFGERHYRTIQAATTQHKPTELRARNRSKGSVVTPDVTEDRLWNYHEKLGVVSFPASVVENVLSMVSYYPAARPEISDDAADPDAIEDGAVASIFQDLGGSDFFAGLVSDASTHYLVPGQGWLIANESDMNGDIQIASETASATEVEWLIVSTDDLRTALNLKSGDSIPVGNSTVWRLYRPSKKRRSMATSPLRHVADDCELLMLYRQELGAMSRSRIPAGILTLPQSLMDAKVPETDRLWLDQLEDDLMAFKNPDSTASLIPTMTGIESKEELELIKLVSLADPDASADLLAKVDAAVRSVALGLEWPVDMLLGIGGLNHWSAWLVERQNFEHHIDPLLKRILGDLSEWFRAVLVASGVDEQTAREVRLWRNAESAITNPQAWDQIRWLHENFLISDDSARKAADAGQVEAPTPEEKRERVLLRALGSPIALANVPGLVSDTDLVPGSSVEPTTTPGVPQSTNPAESTAPPASEPPPILSASPNQLERLSRSLNRIDATLLAEVEKAVESEAARLLRVAEERIKAAAKRVGREVPKDDPGVSLGAEGVAAVLGQALDIDPSEVRTDRIAPALAGAQDDTDRALVEAGVTPPTDGRRSAARALAVATIATAIAQAVASAAVSGRPKPQGEMPARAIVPFSDVRQALDNAGGGIANRVGSEANSLIANGVHTNEALLAGGIGTFAFEWVYGSTPRNSFPPHLRLDGVRFERWDDESLSQEGSGFEWVGGTHFFPGDHRGCLCTYKRTLGELAASQPIAAGASN